MTSCIARSASWDTRSSTSAPLPMLAHSTLTTRLSVSSRLPIDEDDVGLLFEDIHRGRSVIPPHAVPSRPALVRWDPSQPVGLENLVVMEDKEADRHVKECFDASADSPKKRPEELWGHETAEIVARRTEEVRRDREWIM